MTCTSSDWIPITVFLFLFFCCCFIPVLVTLELFEDLRVFFSPEEVLGRKNFESRCTGEELSSGLFQPFPFISQWLVTTARAALVNIESVRESLSCRQWSEDVLPVVSVFCWFSCSDRGGSRDTRVSAAFYRNRWFIPPQLSRAQMWQLPPSGRKLHPAAGLWIMAQSIVCLDTFLSYCLLLN